MHKCKCNKKIICLTCHKLVIKHNNRQIYCSIECKEYKKIYNEINKEKVKKQRKIYRKNHRKEIREYNKKYYKNPLHRLMKQLRGRIGLACITTNTPTSAIHSPLSLRNSHMLTSLSQFKLGM